MITTKNYYSNPNLLKKIRISTSEEDVNVDFRKVLENSFFGSSLTNTNLDSNNIQDSLKGLHA